MIMSSFFLPSFDLKPLLPNWQAIFSKNLDLFRSGINSSGHQIEIPAIIKEFQETFHSPDS